MKYKNKKVKGMDPEERAAYRKSVFRRIVERNGDALKRLAENDKRNEDETK
ncbi:hypothetical protein ABXV15_14445 [Exiguobacterium profundum]|uniref:hypothetical protein n=1 Tax=Exiguobacterium profundum TaxID=307643 RepID=UPI00339AA61B